MKRDTRILIVMLIIFLGAFLRIYNLDGKSFAGDEPNRIAVAKMDTETMLKTSRNVELNPPLHYFLIKLALQFGPSDFLLRLPFALIGIMTIPLVFLIARKFFDDKVALLASLFFALSPLHIQFSQQAGQYALFSFFSALALYFFVRLVRNEKYGITGFVLSSALSLYSHYYTVLFLLSLLAYVLVYKRNALNKFVLSSAAVFTLFLPYVPVLMGQASLSFSAFTPVRLLDVAGIGIVIPFGQSIIHAYKSNILIAISATLIPLVMLRFVLKTKGAVVGLLFYAAVPVMASLLLVAMLPAFSYRFFLPAAVPFAIILSAAIIHAKEKTYGLAALAVAIFVTLFSLNIYYYSTTAVTANNDWRSASAYVSENEKPGDTIYFPANEDRLAFGHYYRGNTETHSYPFDVNLTNVMYSSLWKWKLNTTNETLISRTAEAVEGKERAWIIFPFAAHPYENTIVNYMGEKYTLLENRTFTPSLAIYLYDLQ